MSKSYSKSLSKSRPKSLAEKLKWGFCIIASIAILAILIYIITKDDNKTGGPNMAAPNVLSAAETDKICPGYKGCLIPNDKTRDLNCSKGELTCKDGLTDHCDKDGPCVKDCGEGYTRDCDGKVLKCICDGGIECGGKCQKITCDDYGKDLKPVCDPDDNTARCTCADDKKYTQICKDDNDKVSLMCLDANPNCDVKSAAYDCKKGCCVCEDPNPVFNYTLNKCQA